MIRFSVSALEKAPVTLRGVLAQEFFALGENDPFTIAGDAEYEFTAKIVSGGVLAEGKCKVPVNSVCGRCLNEFNFVLEADEMRLFFELDENVEELDISEDVRAELLLELPMNPLCSENCCGLCPVCGIDRNRQTCSCSGQNSAEKVSPWSALDDLKLD